MSPQIAPLVSHEELLEGLFPDPETRLTVTWLAQMRRRRKIPFVKIGGRIVRYDMEAVRDSIAANFTLDAIIAEGGKP